MVNVMKSSSIGNLLHLTLHGYRSFVQVYLSTVSEAGAKESGVKGQGGGKADFQANTRSWLQLQRDITLLIIPLSHYKAELCASMLRGPL